MKRSRRASELATKKYAKRSQFGEIFHRVRLNKGSLVGLIIISLVMLCFLYSIFFVSWDMVTEMSLRDRVTPPNWKYPFGTDNLGRNMFYRVLYGSRYSLAIGFGGSTIAATLGITLGSLAGYYGGKIDIVVMRLQEIMTSIPGMLLGMVIMSTLGSSLTNLIWCVGVTSIPIYIRMTRASILSIRNNEYVEAAHAIGLPSARIIFAQVLPNGLSPIIITFTMNLGSMVLVAAGLSYLGFGIPPPAPEWGSLIAGSREFLRRSPFLLTYPGVFIMAVSLSFNMLGDGLRDALDPKLKK